MVSQAESGEEGFSGPQVCDVVGITYRQLDYWDRTNLLKPSLRTAHGSGTQRRYSYRDLVQVKVIKSLLDAGVKLQNTRKAIESLRSDHGANWQTASLVLDGGNSVLVHDDEGLIDLLRGGQRVFNVVPVGHMQAELDASIVALAPRREVATGERAPRQAAQGG